MTLDEVTLIKEVLKKEDPKEILPLLVKDGPKDCTWYKLAEWVEENVPQKVVLTAILRIYDSLDPISHFDEGSPMGDIAEQLRCDADVLWMALNEESKNHPRFALSPCLTGFDG